MKEATENKLKESYYFLRGALTTPIPFLGDWCASDVEYEEFGIFSGAVSGTVRSVGLYLMTTDNFKIPGFIMYGALTVPIALINYSNSLMDIEYNQEKQKDSSTENQVSYLPEA